jgi:hypothetical protein
VETNQPGLRETREGSRDLNELLGSEKWNVKQPLLEKAEEWIPTDVKTATEWDDAAVLKRTAALAEIGRTSVWLG